MTSNLNPAPADAYAPDADWVGPAMPKILARLLTIVQTLLHVGHHCATLIQRRTTRRPGFRLFFAVLGAQQAVIHASRHPGILRAPALESLWQRRAATSRDVPAPACPTRAALNKNAQAHPCDEPFRDQIARPAAPRAQYGAPVDPRNPATAVAIKPEILARSIARISRHLERVAIICTSGLQAAITRAIARYQDGEAAECPDGTAPEQELLLQAEEVSARNNWIETACAADLRATCPVFPDSMGARSAAAAVSRRATMYPDRHSGGRMKAPVTMGR